MGSKTGDAAAVWVSITELTPWEKNPRDNAAAVKKVAASIKRFGFAAPIIARENGQVIAGHTRMAAAIQLGLETVPVRYMPGLTDAEAAALALADNRVGEEAKWDDDLLAGVLADIRAAGIDLESTGFDKDELDSLLTEAEQVAAKQIDVSDVRDTFWLSVSGPIPVQPDALDALRIALEALPGVTVNVGTTKRD